MAASPQLVWQLVKGNNCFLRKNVNNTWFSTEPGNLAGKNAYKYSGLANNKTVAVSAGEEGVDVTWKKKKDGKFATFTHKNQSSSKVASSVASSVRGYRTDLVKPAKAAAASAAAVARRERAAAEE